MLFLLKNKTNVPPIFKHFYHILNTISKHILARNAKMPHGMIMNWECHITKMTYYKQYWIHTKLQPILLHVFSQCYWVALHLRCSNN